MKMSTIHTRMNSKVAESYKGKLGMKRRGHRDVADLT